MEGVQYIMELSGGYLNIMELSGGYLKDRLLSKEVLSIQRMSIKIEQT